MKTVVITGASRGIGLALTREFLIHNDTVAALCRAPDDSSELKKLTARFGDQLVTVAADVTDPESLTRACGVLEKRFSDGVEVLVNNAGTMISRDLPEFTQFDAREIEEVCAVNTLGPLRVTQAILPLMRRNVEKRSAEEASIPLVVNVTSIMGSLTRVGERRNYSYSVSKAAFNMLSRLMGRDLQEEGIGVFAIHPGWVQTDMGGTRAQFTPHESAAGIYAQIAAWRPGDPELLDFRGRELDW